MRPRRSADPTHQCAGPHLRLPLRKARRLVGLTNENGVRYCFAYDVLNRLIAESGLDHKLTGYRYKLLAHVFHSNQDEE